MHNGIDGESRWCVNLQFAANVASVRSHGVNREEQLVGNLLVAHATRHTRHYFTFALAQHKLWIIGCNVTIGFALIGCSLFHAVRDFYLAYCRNKYVVLHLAMLLEVLLAVDNVEKYRC